MLHPTTVCTRIYLLMSWCQRTHSFFFCHWGNLPPKDISSLNPVGDIAGHVCPHARLNTSPFVPLCAKGAVASFDRKRLCSALPWVSGLLDECSPCQPSTIGSNSLDGAGFWFWDSILGAWGGPKIGPAPRDFGPCQNERVETIRIPRKPSSRKVRWR